jgi:hypothetical protein
MFEIKYDRDGRVINDRTTYEEIQKQANAVQPPAEHFPDSPEDDNAVQAAESADFQSDDVQESVTPGSGTVTYEEQEEPLVEATVAPKAPQEDSDAKKSFRDVIAAKRKAERERDEYLRRIEELEARPQHREQATTPKEQAEEDEDFHLGADDIAEGKHIAKVDKRAQNKIKALEDRLAKYESKTAEERAEAQLRAKYADFDKVVSRDNIDLLTEAYPELARSLYSTNDLYTKAVSAYTLIKKFGIYQESPFNSEKAVALKNVAKPRPLASVSPQQGDSPLTRANAFANGLTDELKSQLRKEMEQARSR